jgi:hypothetical protein
MIFKNSLPGVPNVEHPLLARIFDESIDPETRRIAFELATKGYAVFDFPDQDFDSMAEAIKQELHPHYDFEGWRDHGHKADISLRVQDAWEFDNNVKRIACNEKVLALLSQLYGRQAWPFQTLNFPVGTQQHFHTDSIHFSSSPERFMCGVWVAMEDIDASNRPLMYFPAATAGRSIRTNTSASVLRSWKGRSRRPFTSRCGATWWKHMMRFRIISMRRRGRR